MRNSSTRWLTILRWTARLWSVASLAILLLFLIGEWTGFFMPTLREWIEILLFPIGMSVGFIVAWRQEKVGGAIAVICMALFYLVDYIITGTWPSGPYFAILAFPGLLFLIVGYLADHWGGSAPSGPLAGAPSG